MQRTDSYEVICDEETGLISPHGVSLSRKKEKNYILYESEDLPTRNIVSYQTSKLLSYGWIFPVR